MKCWKRSEKQHQENRNVTEAAGDVKTIQISWVQVVQTDSWWRSGSSVGHFHLSQSQWGGDTRWFWCSVWIWPWLSVLFRPWCVSLTSTRVTPSVLTFYFTGAHFSLVLFVFRPVSILLPVPPHVQTLTPPFVCLVVNRRRFYKWTFVNNSAVVVEGDAAALHTLTASNQPDWVKTAARNEPLTGFISEETTLVPKHTTTTQLHNLSHQDFTNCSLWPPPASILDLMSVCDQ